MKVPFAIEVESGDLLTYRADAVLLKHAGMSYGVDEAFERLLRSRKSIGRRFDVPAGEHEIVTTKGLAAPCVVFLGVAQLGDFRYGAIRQMAERSLAVLAADLPNVTHVATPVHGPGYGLDESEALLAQVTGYLDAVRDGLYPHNLRKISIVEIDSQRAERLAAVLSAYVGARADNNSSAHGGAVSTMRAKKQPRRRDDSPGFASEQKPHAFVAMPFCTEMEDVFHFGVRAPVNRSGLLCERMDLTPHFGEEMPKLRERIDTASLVIADLSGANPNVLLEVGYAWGRHRPTLLIIRANESIPFDVAGQRCLKYSSIKSLAEKLGAELQGLRMSGALRVSNQLA